MICTHAASKMVSPTLNCLPCEICKGHIDERGVVMNREWALQRFPENQLNIEENEARWHPQPTQKTKRQPVNRADYKTRKEYRFAVGQQNRETRKKVLAVLVVIGPPVIALRLITGSWIVAAILYAALILVVAIIGFVKAKNEYQGDHFWRTLWTELKSGSQPPPNSI